jgi:hypothetical protein
VADLQVRSLSMQKRVLPYKRREKYPQNRRSHKEQPRHLCPLHTADREVNSKGAQWAVDLGRIGEIVWDSATENVVYYPRLSSFSPFYLFFFA